MSASRYFTAQFEHETFFAASAAEHEKAEQHKSSPTVQKTVENGNQGLTYEENMQKKRQEFFNKRMVTTAVKTRFSKEKEKILSSKDILTVTF